MTRTAMGSKAALAEAVRRWGKYAALQMQDGCRKVGIAYLGCFWRKGEGETWPAAFADADRRAGIVKTKEASSE